MYILVKEAHLKSIYEIKFKILFIGKSYCFTQKNLHILQKAITRNLTSCYIRKSLSCAFETQNPPWTLFSLALHSIMTNKRGVLKEISCYFNNRNESVNSYSLLMRSIHCFDLMKVYRPRTK